MVATKLSLADFLSLKTDSDARCEFVDGEIVEMPPESSRNVLVSLFLLQQFLQILPFHWLRRMDTEIVVSGRVRIPDLLVLGEDLAALLEDTGRSTITEDMPAPLLIVEVVSPGKANEDRDYRYKRSEYAARGIPEYWIALKLCRSGMWHYLLPNPRFGKILHFGREQPDPASNGPAPPVLNRGRGVQRSCLRSLIGRLSVPRDPDDLTR